MKDFKKTLLVEKQELEQEFDKVANTNIDAIVEEKIQAYKETIIKEVVLDVQKQKDAILLDIKCIDRLLDKYPEEVEENEEINTEE